MNETPSDRSGAYWDRWREERERKSDERWTEWWSCPLIVQHMYGRVVGEVCRTERAFFTALASLVPWPERPRTLSLCGGVGDLERRLYAYGLIGETTIIEVSSEAARIGEQRAKEEEVPITYRLDDANEGEYGKSSFDLCIANSALHHLERLDEVFAGIAGALKPKGILFLQEYVGPDHFQWEEKWIRAAKKVLKVIPPELRRKPDGTTWEEPYTPSVEEVKANDPTEALRSSDILETLTRWFDPLLLKSAGGGFVQSLYPLILPNLDPDDEGHRTLIIRLMALEDLLLDEYAYPVHFIVSVACPHTVP